MPEIPVTLETEAGGSQFKDSLENLLRCCLKITITKRTEYVAQWWNTCLAGKALDSLPKNTQKQTETKNQLKQTETNKQKNQLRLKYTNYLVLCSVSFQDSLLKCLRHST